MEKEYKMKKEKEKHVWLKIQLRNLPEVGYRYRLRDSYAYSIFNNYSNKIFNFGKIIIGRQRSGEAQVVIRVKDITYMEIEKK